MKTALALFMTNGHLQAQAHIELALSAFQRTQGLSHRSTVPDGTGMWFPTTGPFWMKNVYAPLELAFLDDHGIITEIVSMPLPEPDKPLQLFQPSRAGATSSLEVPANWLSKHGINVGSEVIIWAKSA